MSDIDLRSDVDVTKSVTEFECNVHAYGKKILTPRRDDFAEGRLPKGFFMTRESYERLLRRLVLGYSKRIRWKVATATTLQVSPKDCTSLKSVRFRTADGIELEQESALVIGVYNRPFPQTFLIPVF